MAEMEEERKAEMEITEEETEITEAEVEITDTKEKLPEQMGAMLKGVIKLLSKTKSLKETFLGNNMIFSISQKIIYAHKRLNYLHLSFTRSAGKDYPTNSLAALRKKFPGLELAPEDLIPKDYPRDRLPGRGGGGGKRKNGGGNRNQARPSSQNGGGNRNQARPSSPSGDDDSYCPGGGLEDCIRFCKIFDKI